MSNPAVVSDRINNPRDRLPARIWPRVQLFQRRRYLVERAKARNGLTLQGGNEHRSVGRRMRAPSERTCRKVTIASLGPGLNGSGGQYDEPVLPCRVRHSDPGEGFSRTYMIPKIGHPGEQGVFQSQNREPCSRAKLRRSGGHRRAVSGGGAPGGQRCRTWTVNLIAPGASYGPIGINQLDFRLAKTITFRPCAGRRSALRHLQRAELERRS